MDTTLAQPSTQPDTSVGLTLGEYAERVGLSVWTVRAKIRRGEIPAQLVKGRRGPEYRIAPDATVGQGLHNGEAQPSPSVGQGLGQPDTTVGELIALVREKDQTIIELAGRCGWLQSENQRLTETIRQLQAPAPVSADTPIGARQFHDNSGYAESPPRPPEASTSHAGDPVIPAPRPRWWARFWRWGVA